MKNKIQIVLLLLTLFGQSVFAQRKLSPTLRPYAENWTYTLVKSMNLAGFDMPTMPANEIDLNQGPTSLKLDSTKTFYLYDLSPVGDSSPIFRSTYAYPLPNTKIETNFQYDNGQWQPLNRSTLICDGQQRLVEAIAEVYDTDSHTFKPDSKLELFPHGDSPELMDAFSTSLWDSTIADWHVMLSNQNTFDAQNRLLESAYSLDYFGTTLALKEVYSYNAEGDNHLIEEFTLEGSAVVPVSRTEIAYVDHRPIEVLVSSSDGISFFPKSRTNSAYTLFGSIRKQMQFEWNAAEQRWYLIQTNDYGYDGDQRLSSKVNTYHILEEQQLTTYAYSANQNLYSEMYLSWDDDLFDWVLDGRKYYYFGGFVSVKPNPGSVQILQVSPNPAGHFVQLQLDQPAFIQVYNTQGGLVHSAACQPDQMFNLGELPSGLYYITAQDGNKVYAARLVKS